MKDFSALPARLEVGQRLYGFVVRDVFPLPKLRMMAYVCEHEATGAEIVHLHADDAEQTMAIVVRTPPVDDTGLPHIMEHTVLCGSERYPLKEPFTELLKTSLATFLNAFTAEDHTVYPCASMHRKDFYNLASVYCDAVFHPRLTREHFQQEGHHLEWNAAGELEIKGVVYSEMKGYYAELEEVLTRTVVRTLFEGSIYAYDAGGDPSVIPRLRYEEFKRYHERYYHVGNAAFFFYGSLPTEEHLKFLAEECLGRCRRGEKAVVEEPPRVHAGRRVRVKYPIGEHESTEGRTAHAVALLTHRIEDTVTTLALRVLEFYLVGHEGAPLRRALIESRLGSGLIGTGLGTWHRAGFFGVGIRGSEPERLDAFWELVRGTLKKIVAEGLNRERVEVALYQRELGQRLEVSMSPSVLLRWPGQAWLLGLPLRHYLRLDEDVAALRAQLAARPRFLEELMEEKLLANEDYCLVTCEPDPGYYAREEAAFKAEMARRAAAMSAEERERVRLEAEKLKELQEQPDSEEARASLPRLKLADVGREPVLLETTEEQVGGATLLRTETFTNGLVYVTAAVDMRGLPEELWAYVPVYLHAVKQVGAGGLDYVAMAEKEVASCGGVSVTLKATRRYDEEGVWPLLVVGVFGLEREVGRVLEVVGLRLMEAEFGARERLRDVVLQQRAGVRDVLPGTMTGLARRRSARGLSAVAWVSEVVRGLTGVRSVERVARMVERGNMGEVIARLERIREHVRMAGVRCVSMAGGEESAKRVREWMRDFVRSTGDARATRGDGAKESGLYEGIELGTQVAANAVSVPVLVPEEDRAVMRLIEHMVTYEYLWDRVRVQGSAYHASAGYSHAAGVLSLASGDDPHVRRTLEVFMGVCDYLEGEMDVSEEGMEQAIIGTLKQYDRPVRGMEACLEALSDWAAGLTAERIRRERERLLELKGRDVRRVSAEFLRPAFRDARVCVVGGAELLERARKELWPKELAIEPAIDSSDCS